MVGLGLFFGNGGYGTGIFRTCMFGTTCIIIYVSGLVYFKTNMFRTGIFGTGMC